MGHHDESGEDRRHAIERDSVTEQHDRSSIARNPPDRAIDVALAEFTALRGFIATTYQMRIALLIGALTIIGIVAGLALNQHPSNGDLLLLIPVLASVVAILYSELSRRIRMNGRYIDTELWPYFKKLVDPKLPSWEGYWNSQSKVRVAIGDWQPNVLLAVVSIFVLFARPLGEQHTSGPLWGFGAVFTVLAMVYACVAYRPLSPPPSDLDDDSDGMTSNQQSTTQRKML